MEATNPHPTPEILDESAVEEIETNLADWNVPLEQFYDYVRPLCATVQALQVKLALCKGDPFAANPDKWGHESIIAALREQLAEEQSRNQIQADTIMELEADLTSAAARMRDTCVAYLRSTADALNDRQETECPSGTGFNHEAALRRRIASELAFLTLAEEVMTRE